MMPHLSKYIINNNRSTRLASLTCIAYFQSLFILVKSDTSSPHEHIESSPVSDTSCIDIAYQ